MAANGADAAGQHNGSVADHCNVSLSRRIVASLLCVIVGLFAAILCMAIYINVREFNGVPPTVPSTRPGCRTMISLAGPRQTPPFPRFPAAGRRHVFAFQHYAMAVGGWLISATLEIGTGTYLDMWGRSREATTSCGYLEQASIIGKAGPDHEPISVNFGPGDTLTIHPDGSQSMHRARPI